MKNTIKEIATQFNYSLCDITGARKYEDLAHLRGCLYAVLKYETDLSTTQIGRLLNRTHSTVVNVGNKYYYLHTRHGMYPEVFSTIRKAIKKPRLRTGA